METARSRESEGFCVSGECEGVKYIIPDRNLRLRDYPYVVVRFACRDCPRIGRYRLPVLAERFGAEAFLVDVLEAISAACLRTKEKHPGRRCQAYLPDLADPRPPDLPASAGKRLRVINGGRA